MTKAITLIDCLKKVSTVYNLGDPARKDDHIILPYPTFKKIMMLYPTDGPVISNERNVKEKYRTLKEFGILNQSGCIYIDELQKWVNA